MTINQVKQLGLKALAQLANEILSYCKNTVTSGNMILEAGVSAVGSEIDQNVQDGLWYAKDEISDVSSEQAQGLVNTVQYLSNLAQTVRSEVIQDAQTGSVTLTNQYGKVFHLLYDGANLVDGYGNIIYNAADGKMRNIITAADGATYPLPQLFKDLGNNSQMYDTMAGCLQEAINDGDLSFQSVRADMTQKYSVLSEDSNNIIAEMHQACNLGGLGAMLAWCKEWFNSMHSASAASQDPNAIQFTDNKALVAQTNLAGCLGSLLSTGLQVASSIITAVAPIVGMVIGGIGMAVNFGLNALANAADANVYGTIKFKENGNYCYPYAVLQATCPVTRFNTLMENTQGQLKALRDVLFDNGTATVSIPGGELYCWLNSDRTSINYEVHVTPFAKTLSIRSLLYNVSGNYATVPCLSSTVIWDNYINDVDVDLRELKNNRWSPAQLDTELLRRYYYNYSYVVAFFMSVFPNYEAGNGMCLYLRVDDASVTDVTRGLVRWINSLSTASPAISWSDIYNDNQMLSWCRADSSAMTYGPGKPKFYYRAGMQDSGYYLAALIHDKLIFDNNNFQSYCNMSEVDIIPISKFGDWYVTGPQVTKWSLIGATLITAAIAATLVVTAVVVKRKVTKSMSAKKASLARGVETSWEAYKANPSGENYDAYYKAVRKNNKWAKFLHGTSYSLDGMWGSTDSGDGASASSDSSGIFSSLANNERVQNQVLDGLGIPAASQDTIYSLIETTVVQKLDELIGLIKGPTA